MLKKSDVNCLVRKGDFAVIAVICTVAAALLFLPFFKASHGKYVTVKVDNKTVGSYSLNENRTVKIQAKGGSTNLVIKNGAAYFEGSTCPDKLCEKMGKLSNVGDTAVCLPLKTVAEVTDS